LITTAGTERMPNLLARLAMAGLLRAEGQREHRQAEQPDGDRQQVLAPEGEYASGTRTCR
jgi:hypothetical protein